MYGGGKTLIEFEADISVLDAVYDRFGDKVRVLPHDERKAPCRVEVQVGKPLITWFIGFGSSLKVRSPSNVIEQIKTLLSEAVNNYG